MMTWLFDSARLSVLQNHLLAASIKGILVLISAAAVCFLLRRASAASRHLVWSLALTGLLALPILSLALPVWQIAVLPSAPVDSISTETQAPELVPNAAKMNPITSEHLIKTNAPATTNVDPQIAADLRSDLNGREKSVGTRAPFAWVRLGLILWLAGAVLIFGRLLIGTASIWWIAHRARTIKDAVWLNLTADIARQIGLTRRVRMFKTSRITMPVTSGLISSAILLPAEADDWPDGRRQVVLLHELAHVKRWDCMTQLLAQMACCVYWFNPLVWLATRQLRIERERACDDQVIDVGTKASDYAGHLLDMARTFRSTTSSSLATVAIARRSQLEGRLLAILDPGLKRRGLNRIAVVLVGIVIVCVVLPLATIRLSAKAQTHSLRPAASIAASITEPAHHSTPKLTTLPVQSEQQRVEDAIQPPSAGTDTAELEETHQDQEAAGSSTPAQQKDKNAAIEALREAMKDEDSEVRQHALFALTHIGDQAATAVLVEALTDRSWQVRAKAAFGLGLRGGRNGIDALVSALQDTSWQVREQAAWGLGLQGDARAIEPLINALRDDNPEVREKAAWALGLKGDKRSVDALIAALKDSAPGVRAMAAWALGLKGDTRAANAVKDALKDPDRGVRQKAAWALGMLLLKSGGALTGLPDPDDIDKETEVDQEGKVQGGVTGGVSGGVFGGVSGGMSRRVSGGLSSGIGGGISGGVAGGSTDNVGTGVGAGTGVGVGVVGGVATGIRTGNGGGTLSPNSSGKTKSKPKQK